jgi:hypothetical protein
MRSMCSLVDILGEGTAFLVECQGDLLRLRKITRGEIVASYRCAFLELLTFTL